MRSSLDEVSQRLLPLAEECTALLMSSRRTETSLAEDRWRVTSQVLQIRTLSTDCQRLHFSDSLAKIAVVLRLAARNLTAQFEQVCPAGQNFHKERSTFGHVSASLQTELFCFQSIIQQSPTDVQTQTGWEHSPPTLVQPEATSWCHLKDFECDCSWVRVSCGSRQLLVVSTAVACLILIFCATKYGLIGGDKALVLLICVSISYFLARRLLEDLADHFCGDFPDSSFFRENFRLSDRWRMRGMRGIVSG